LRLFPEERRKKKKKKKKRNVRGDAEAVSAEGAEQGVGLVTEQRRMGREGTGGELGRFLRHPVVVIDSSAKPG